MADELRPYTVIGGGAIGGTLAFHLTAAGHPVIVVDADEAHVTAIQKHGLLLRRPSGDERVAIEATGPAGRRQTHERSRA